MPREQQDVGPGEDQLAPNAASCTWSRTRQSSGSCLLHPAVPSEGDFPPSLFGRRTLRVCDSLRGAEGRHKITLEKLQTELAPSYPGSFTQALGAQGAFLGLSLCPSASLPFPFLPHHPCERGSSERGPQDVAGSV